VVHPLKEGVEVDHCHHCGGTYLDAGEEATILGPLVASEVWQDTSMCTDQGPSKLISPVSGKPMRTYRVFFAKAVVVDRCEESGGLWLDAGEADTLRKIVENASQSESSPLSEKRPNLGIGVYILQFFSGAPVEMWNPRVRFPWATLSVIGLCVVVFGADWMTQTDLDAPVLIHFALHPNLFQGVNIWSCFTYMFLHAGFAHIFGNLYILYILGDNIEDKLGIRYFLLLYLLSGLVGGLAEIGLSNSGVPVVGASGAVAGVMAAYWVLFPRVRLRLLIVGIPVYMGVAVFFGFWAGLNFLMIVLDVGGVAWTAHLGGFVTGLCLALPFRPRPFASIMQERVDERARRQAP